MLRKSVLLAVACIGIASAAASEPVRAEANNEPYLYKIPFQPDEDFYGTALTWNPFTETILIADEGAINDTSVGVGRIHSLSLDGTSTLVAGSDDPCAPTPELGVKQLAREASLGWPSGIAINSRREIFFSDSFHHRIYRITPTGYIEVVAGTGIPGFDTSSNGNGLATEQPLNKPLGIAIGPDDEIYVVDSGNRCIRVISRDGNVQTLLQVQPDNPFSPKQIAIGPDRTLVISVTATDTSTAGLVRISPDRKTKEWLVSPDHPSMRAATGDPPRHVVAITDDGTVFNAAWHDDQIQQRTSTGELVTIAGVDTSIHRDEEERTPIPVPASQARIINPSGLAAIPHGGLIVGEFGVDLEDRADSRISIMFPGNPERGAYESDDRKLAELATTAHASNDPEKVKSAVESIQRGEFTKGSPGRNIIAALRNREHGRSGTQVSVGHKMRTRLRQKLILEPLKNILGTKYPADVDKEIETKPSTEELPAL